MFRRLILAAALGATLATAGQARAGNWDARFDALAQEFLGRWLGANPQMVTRLGLHDEDRRLARITETTLDEDTRWLRDFQQRLSRVPAAGLSPDRIADLELMESRIERLRYEAEVLQPYANDPSAYADIVGGSIALVLERDFDSVCGRMRSLSRRLDEVPEVLRAARLNLRRASRVHTEVGIERFEAVLRLYREAVPAMAAPCREPLLQADLAEADTAAVRAVEAFLVFLERELLPQAGEDFALGERYERYLAARDPAPLAMDSLLARAGRSLEAAHARLRVVADRIAPGLDPREALRRMEREAVAPRDRASLVERQIDSVWTFMRSRELVPLPDREEIAIHGKPGVADASDFAGMWVPGAWEPRSAEGYCRVTLTGSSWTEAQRRAHAAYFNRYTIAVVLAGELVPGRYLQSVALRHMNSRLRQALVATAGDEGWAHYCEQLAIEEGLGGGDPRFELAQLQRSIRRLGRLVVALRLHTRGLTLDEAARFLEEQCFLDPASAAREARLAAVDPSGLDPVVGKWRILDLRDEARAALGTRFRSRAFHEALLREGGMPGAFVRARVLTQLRVALVP